MKRLFDDKTIEELKPCRLQYDLKAAAYQLCTSVDTLENWIKTYQIHSYKVGGKGKLFIRHNDLANFANEISAVGDFMNGGRA